jgi:hypothetical protein
MYQYTNLSEQFTLKMEATTSFGKFISYHITTLSQNPEVIDLKEIHFLLWNEIWIAAFTETPPMDPIFCPD